MKKTYKLSEKAFQLIFGGSGIVPAAMVAILLNILLPKDTAE